MFSAPRKRLHVSPTTVIATLALIFAMTGGAYATTHFLITSTKQISPKVLKSLKGANGKTGAAGPAGPAGAAGAGTAGATGPQGPAGTAGAKGETGATGVPGPPGPKGSTGSPWTAGGTLPSGKTETGAWSVGPITKASLGGAFFATTSVSFAIPLTAGLDAAHIHYLNPAGKEVVFEEELKEVTSTQCLGSKTAPTAEPGNFCVYAANEEGAVGFSNLEGITNPGAPAEEGTGTTGTLLSVEPIEEKLSVEGTWAVTAP
jgi:hypothetical protein